MKTIATAAMAMAVLAGGPAAAQGLPGQERSFALVSMFAERGDDCGLLRPWQAATLRAQVEEASRGWDGDTLARVMEERARLIAETACDSELLNAWIEAAQEGFDAEYLPPYLVVYRALARMDEPPAAFTAVTLRLDYAPAIDAIGSHLDAMAASGRPAEGGKPWPEFIARTEAFALEFAARLEDEGDVADSRYSRGEAAGWLAQSALVTELWLDDALGEAPGGDAAE